MPAIVRREQSERELARLGTAINAWFVRRRADSTGDTPFAQLHRTRLDALEQVLKGGLAALSSALESVDVTLGRSAADVNVDCREIDEAVVWMHRVWTYYREKFDQRDDPVLAPTLKAADEVVWSCYRHVFVSTGLPPGVRIGPAPLAYVEAEYSPATWEAAKQAPSALREATDIGGLESFLANLPVPTLRLPTWCIDSPWWLVFIAHEVGHNIQQELGLVQPFRAVVAAAWQPAEPEATARAERWGRWSAELFADLVSVAMIGPWAIKALRELVLGPPEEMARPSGAYPAPIVRLVLMARAADRLGMSGTEAIEGIDPAASSATAQVVADMGDVDRVLDRALGPLTEGGKTIAELCGLTAVRDGLTTKARSWAGELALGAGAPVRSLLSPRYLVCASFLAWQRTAGLPSTDERRKAIDQLAANANVALATSGPEGTRAGTERPELAAQGTALGEWLLGRSHELRAATQPE